MKQVSTMLWGGIMTICISCSSGGSEKYGNFSDYPLRTDSLKEMAYTPNETSFALWAPTAKKVKLLLYNTATDSVPIDVKEMKKESEGTWRYTVLGDLLDKFYTFNVEVDGNWLGETPGINAKAVGVNGKRAAIIDMAATNPDGWLLDKRPPLNSFADMVIYEMHHRDFSIHPSSGITNKGKYLALTEPETVTPEQKLSTGIDHLVDLGITHVHLLPSFDFASIDESALYENNYNWGYDPQNYNVPEGSYAIDPFDPYSRIYEFKRMVQSLHKAGIRVVMDVVYNHTYNLAGSSFERTVPGYFYRFNENGTYADASACGNETASERPMMRKYMIESVRYWINEYHIDGFRFDLMGIHDIETMNAIRKAVDEIDPTICIYGEGWAAAAPQYPADSLAMKGSASKMPGVAVFSDELRDGLRGPFNNNSVGLFLAGIAGGEESIKFGIAGAVHHPQIDYTKVNYSKKAWAEQPTQMISYASCHDDMCLVDRLKASIPDISIDKVAKLSKLAQTVVFTSQGIPFMLSGEEVLRDKKGVHNSYKSPDTVNEIDWNNKHVHSDVYRYYQNLITLRKNHPAFRMGDADMIRERLTFLPVKEDNVVAFMIDKHANGDAWETIVVAFNTAQKATTVNVPAGRYTVVCTPDGIDEKGVRTVNGKEISLPSESWLIMYK